MGKELWCKSMSRFFQVLAHRTDALLESASNQSWLRFLHFQWEKTGSQVLHRGEVISYLSSRLLT